MLMMSFIRVNHQIGDGKKGSFCELICDGMSEEMATGKGRKPEDYVPIKYDALSTSASIDDII